MLDFATEPLEDTSLPRTEAASDPWLFSPRCNFGCGGRSRRFNRVYEDYPTATVWQPDVYAEAAALAERIGARQVLDFGCGSAAKLLRFFDHRTDRRLTGIDFRGSLLLARNRSSSVDWQECNLGLWADLDRVAAAVTCDGPQLLIASDVVEHLPDPRPLVATLRTLLLRHPDSRLILSTPDRHRTRGPGADGVPANEYHVREWTLEELTRVLNAAGLIACRTAYARSHLDDGQRATAFVECMARAEAHERDLTTMPGATAAAATLEATMSAEEEGWERTQQLLFHVPQLRMIHVTGGSPTEESLRVGRAAGLMPARVGINDGGLAVTPPPRPAVTVALQVRNTRLDWLDECLVALASQSLVPDEVVVVDLGSRLDYRLTLSGFLADRLRIPFRVVRGTPGLDVHSVIEGRPDDGPRLLAVLEGSDVPLNDFIELASRCLGSLPHIDGVTTRRAPVAATDQAALSAPAARGTLSVFRAQPGGASRGRERLVELPVAACLARPVADELERTEPARPIVTALWAQARRALGGRVEHRSGAASGPGAS